MKKSDKNKEEEFVNPIDPDKVAENPGTLEYAHHVGSGLVKAEDVGKQKGRAIAAMEHQTDQQLSQIYEQMQLLAEQAKKINKRKEISEEIYQANFRFEPIINHVYHLYKDENDQRILSIIGPNQWGRTKVKKYEWMATIKLLADHTWEILDTAEDQDADNQK
ncbi:DUF2452 domain-containing protein [Paracrocinitomix mangrovi]|uniref:DUF2452 domain-containing protein n=1 Tax=Paracrocinitomix mangrovi TaxID=2862509 RepID=UPI001C8E370C|nr:DUF2452 domain-containing protein [Paracrocinitomix mangrovi]UKN02681.1 DUF2452 domain-containing protein [Paracrocinitomix mangrovi]